MCSIQGLLCGTLIVIDCIFFLKKKFSAPVPAHHPSERHALDLAGSREQRGSAFELYRKPSIGAGVGHLHGMR